MPIENSWNNGLVGKDYIRVNHSPTKHNRYIYRIKTSRGCASWNLEDLSLNQRKKFVRRALSGYNERVDFTPSKIHEEE